MAEISFASQFKKSIEELQDKTGKELSNKETKKFVEKTESVVTIIVNFLKNKIEVIASRTTDTEKKKELLDLLTDYNKKIDDLFQEINSRLAILSKDNISKESYALVDGIKQSIASADKIRLELNRLIKKVSSEQKMPDTDTQIGETVLDEPRTGSANLAEIEAGGEVEVENKDQLVEGRRISDRIREVAIEINLDVLPQQWDESSIRAKELVGEMENKKISRKRKKAIIDELETILTEKEELLRDIKQKAVNEIDGLITSLEKLNLEDGDKEQVKEIDQLFDGEITASYKEIVEAAGKLKKLQVKYQKVEVVYGSTGDPEVLDKKKKTGEEERIEKLQDFKLFSPGDNAIYLWRIYNSTFRDRFTRAWRRKEKIVLTNEEKQEIISKVLELALEHERLMTTPEGEATSEYQKKMETKFGESSELLIAALKEGDLKLEKLRLFRGDYEASKADKVMDKIKDFKDFFLAELAKANLSEERTKDYRNKIFAITSNKDLKYPDKKNSILILLGQLLGERDMAQESKLVAVTDEAVSVLARPDNQQQRSEILALSDEFEEIIRNLSDDEKSAHRKRWNKLAKEKDRVKKTEALKKFIDNLKNELDSKNSEIANVQEDGGVPVSTQESLVAKLNTLIGRANDFLSRLSPEKNLEYQTRITLALASEDKDGNARDVSMKVEALTPIVEELSKEGLPSPELIILIDRAKELIGKSGEAHKYTKEFLKVIKVEDENGRKRTEEEKIKALTEFVEEMEETIRKTEIGIKAHVQPTVEVVANEVEEQKQAAMDLFNEAMDAYFVLIEAKPELENNPRTIELYEELENANTDFGKVAGDDASQLRQFQVIGDRFKKVKDELLKLENEINQRGSDASSLVVAEINGDSENVTQKKEKFNKMEEQFIGIIMEGIKKYREIVIETYKEAGYEEENGELSGVVNGEMKRYMRVVISGKIKEALARPNFSGYFSDHDEPVEVIMQEIKMRQQEK